MARDKWGFGPTFLESPDKEPVCTLTVPVQCQKRVLNLLIGRKVAKGLVNKTNQTMTYRVYTSRHSLQGVFCDLESLHIPFNLEDGSGFVDCYRCQPDGRYTAVSVGPFGRGELPSWEGQWELRKLLKTIRLINPEDFDPVEFM